MPLLLPHAILVAILALTLVTALIWYIRATG